MKITIEPETEEEKKDYPEDIILTNVFEFASAWRFIENDMFERSQYYMRLGDDRHVLVGKLYELISRLKSGT